jgi:hypothetical protein
MIRKGIAASIILLCLSLSVAGCSLFQSDSLPSTPSGWTTEREGWIPPIPRGMDNPGPLSQADWDKVLKLAYTEMEVVKQQEK